jgi:tetratricopeptide (TPR) repeat protein
MKIVRTRRLPLLLLGMILLSRLPASADSSPPSAYQQTVTLGEACLAAQRWDEALTVFQRLAQAAPAGYEVELGLGRALLGAGRYAEAVAPLEAAVLLRPDLPRPRVLLGRAYSRQGQYDRAEDPLLAAYNLDPAYEPAWGELAGIYLATARAAAAEPFLALLVARHPADLTLLGKQLAAARTLGRGDLVRATLAQLIAALPPGQTPAWRRELALDLLATDLAVPRDLAQAEAQARAAVTLEPGNPENAAVLGQVLLAAGKTPQALTVLRGVPAEDFREPEACVRLAEAELAAGQAAAALALARQALRLAPNSEEAAWVGREAAARAGQAEQELRYARRLVALHPADAPARLALAASLDRAGQPAEALVQCDLAAGEETAGPEALRALAQRAAALGNPDYQLTVARRLAQSAPATEIAPLVDLLLAQQRWGEAEARLADWARVAPEQAEQSGAPRLVRALRAARQGDPAAEAELRAIIREGADGSSEAAVALAGLEGRWAGAGPGAAAAQLGALADGQPERADLALAAAGQYERAGLWARAGAYYERVRGPQGREALQRAAVAYDRAGDTGGLLRVAATYLLREAHDAEGLALVAELQAAPTPPGAPVRAATLGLVQAQPWSVNYERHRVDLFAACDRLEPLAATLTARAPRLDEPAERVALALLQERRHDPQGALRTLNGVAPAQADRAAVALVRARLLRETGRPEAALAALETAVGEGDAEVARERGELLAADQRPTEALGEYLRALRAGADATETLGKVGELWSGKQLTLTALLAGLDGVCAGLADPAPIRRWVQDRLPGADPAVQAWLQFHRP